MTPFTELCVMLARRRRGFLFVSGMAVLLRLLVGLHSYSGEATPPRFGDYEAQRHWMEMTVHTPVREWYVETPANRLEYWGLDYPPLTAYQSMVHGWVMHYLDPDSVALQTSRGYESTNSKTLLRWTVLTSDLLLFFPPALALVTIYHFRKRDSCQVYALAAILLNPAAILIDHGHFQYNCISLGLAMGAAAAIINRRELMGAVLFTLSLNHKQMSMYFAPAFFAHLLGRSLHGPRPILAVTRLGLTVIATFVVCWAPYLHSKQGVLQVLTRLVPLSRGLYEDHVANFWCATASLVKWKRLLPLAQLARLSLIATLLSLLPSMWQQIKRPSQKGLLMGMLNSSLAFYLFAFQVHEKSILLPLLPASLLALDEPSLYRWLCPLACFSMYPLLQRDGLVLPYTALLLLFFLLFGPPGSLDKDRSEQRVSSQHASQQSSQDPSQHSMGGSKLGGWGEGGVLGRMWELWGRVERFVFLGSLLGAIGLHLAVVVITPPKRYPYLHPALMTTYSFLHFVPIAIYSNWRQWATREEDLYDTKND